jgi:site-specific DNA-cytosine methylase
MKVLVACEESQAVTIEFRKIGHEAYSCDIEPCSGGHPEWHLQQDVTELLKQDWDMVLAFPPCTYLTHAGTRHFSTRINPVEKVEKRKELRCQAHDFFMMFANCDCEKVAIENPVGFMNTEWRKPDQLIHPYYFGDPVQKRTCLWLKGLPLLQPTDMLEKPKPKYFCAGEKCRGKAIGWCEGIKGTTGGQKGRAKARSKTFTGIAKAMAEQWGGTSCAKESGRKKDE